MVLFIPIPCDRAVAWVAPSPCRTFERPSFAPAQAAIATNVTAPVPLAPAPPPPFAAQVDAASDDADAAILAAIDAAVEVDATLPFDDPMALHRETPDELRALLGEAASVPFPVGGGPWRFSQGNRAIAHHSIGSRACLEGLRDVVLQSPEQRERCGTDGMVPVWDRGGGMENARYCIDVFEFPNKTCELPFVFITPAHWAVRECATRRASDLAVHAGRVEHRLPRRPGRRPGPGLRLRRRDGPHRVQQQQVPGGRALLRRLHQRPKLWTTCGTNTEPSGSFPRCRSRFGVFDQHGNVAEIMTRFEPADGRMYTQLKGSAFFYVDVAKKPTDPGGYWTKYPDQCNFDPRWQRGEARRSLPT